MGIVLTDPLKNYSFLLRVEATYDIPCRNIQAFKKENEYEYIQEGGLNDYVHMVRKPVTQPPILEIERYVGLYVNDDEDKVMVHKEGYDPLPKGKILTMPLLLMVSEPWDREFKKPIRTFAFTGCVVTGKEYGGLDAESSGLLTEKITIAYQELLVIDE